MVTEAPARPPPKPAIECRGLHKVFRDFWRRPRVSAVSGLDLDVLSGEVYGLLGPNGSGKSTTLKTILGLLFPTRGTVRLLGRPPTDVATKARVGYLPEESCFYPFLDGRETLEFYGAVCGLDRSTRKARARSLLEMFGLEGAAARPVGEYSKGMQRRIGLAQALIHDPDLLILDEPTVGLDPSGTRAMKDLILELRAGGRTVLLSSHLLADVEDVCDRVGILYGGRKVAEGAVGELLRVAGQHVIETDRLAPATIEKIREIVGGEGKKVHAVRAPRQKLEAFFLETVERAQESGSATSGARSGGALAEFLRRPRAAL
jgi:ABC-2 type transport system ATP-binding protein